FIADTSRTSIQKEFSGGFLSVPIFHDKLFCITGESFLYPSVCRVSGSNVVPKPFVRIFMHDHPVCLQIPVCKMFRFIAAPFEMIAISYGTLMLHTNIRGFYHFKPITVKRVGTKPVLERREGLMNFRAKIAGDFFLIVVQYPKIHFQRPFLAGIGIGGVHILSDIKGQTVVVDGTFYLPFVT